MQQTQNNTQNNLQRSVWEKKRYGIGVKAK